MHRSDFEGPPVHLSLISVLGGIATAIALIAGLEAFAQHQRSLRHDSTHLLTPTLATSKLAESACLSASQPKL